MEGETSSNQLYSLIDEFTIIDENGKEEYKSNNHDSYKPVIVNEDYVSSYLPSSPNTRKRINIGLNNDISDDEYHNAPPSPILNINIKSSDIIGDCRSDYVIKYRFENNTIPLSSKFFNLVNEYYQYYLKIEESSKKIEILKNEQKKVENSLWSLSKKDVDFRPTSCMDGEKVYPSNITYEIYELDDKRYEILESLSARLINLLYKEYSEPYIELRMCKKKLEVFIDEFIERTNLLNDSHNISSEKEIEIKGYIQSLFHFIKLTRNCQESSYLAEFNETLIHLLDDLISLALLINKHDIHYFILNELLHCSKISPWGISYFQPILHKSRKKMWECIDEYINILTCLLSPVIKQRNSEINKAELNNDDVYYILAEEDYIMLFRQLKFMDFVNTMISKPQSDSSTVEDINRTLDLCENLISICTNSITHFRFYKHMSIQLCNALISILEQLNVYASFLTDLSLENEEIELLKTRIDKMFIYVFKFIFKEPNLWQFLVYIPYQTLNIKSVIYIFLTIYNGYNVDINEINTLTTYEQWIIDRKKDCRREDFIQTLVKDKKGEFLLYTLSRLSICHIYNSHFVRIIIYEILMATQIIEVSKDIYSKSSFSILGEIFMTKEYLISFLLKLLNEYIDSFDQQIIKLFDHIPLHSFKLQINDAKIICSWLFSEDIMSTKVILALKIIDNLNWEYVNDQLFIDKEVHREISLFIAEASIKNSERFLYFTQSNRKKFQNWSEDRILLMKHIDNFGKRILPPLSLYSTRISKLYDEAISNSSYGNPTALYILLEVSDIMDNAESIKEKGIPLLKKLIYQKNRRYVLRVIHDFTLSLSELYSENPKLSEELNFFKEICMSLMGTTSYWYLKVESSLDDYIQAIVTVQIKRLIDAKLFKNAMNLLKFWYSETIKQDGWFKHLHLKNFVEHICKLYMFYFKDDTFINDHENQLKLNKVKEMTLESIFSTKPDYYKVVGQFIGIIKPKTKINNPYLTCFYLIISVIEFRNNFQDIQSSVSTFAKLYTYIIQCLETIEDDHPSKIILWQLFFVLHFFNKNKNIYSPHLIEAIKREKRIKVKSNDEYEAMLNKSNLFNEDIIKVFTNWLKLDLRKILDINSLYNNKQLDYNHQLLRNVVEFSSISSLWMLFRDNEDINQDFKQSENLWLQETQPVLRRKVIQNPIMHVSRSKTQSENMNPPNLPIYKNLKSQLMICHKDIVEEIRKDFKKVIMIDDSIAEMAKKHEKTLESYNKLLHDKYIVLEEETSTLVKCDKYKNYCKGGALFKYTIKKSVISNDYESKFEEITLTLNSIFNFSYIIPDDLITLLLRLEYALLEKKYYIDKSLGIQLFYEFIENSKATLSNISTSSNVLRKLIKILYSDYITTNVDELHKSLKLMLKDSDSYMFLIPLFSPNIANSEIFVEMYKLALQDCLDITKSDTISKILMRFDLNRDITIEHQVELLNSLGYYISYISDSNQSVKKILLSHLNTIALHQFPIHLTSLTMLALKRTEENFTKNVWPILLSLPLNNLKWKDILDAYQLLSQSSTQAISNFSAFPYFQRFVDTMLNTFISFKDLPNEIIQVIIRHYLSIYGIWITEFPHQTIMTVLMQNIEKLMNFNEYSLTYLWEWFIEFSSQKTPEVLSNSLQMLLLTNFSKLPWNKIKSEPEKVLLSLHKLCQLYKGKYLIVLIAHMVKLTAKPLENNTYLSCLSETIILIILSHPWPFPQGMFNFFKSMLNFPWYCLEASYLSNSEYIRELIITYTKPPELIPLDKPTKPQKNVMNNSNFSYLINQDIDPSNYIDESAGRLHIALRFLRMALCWEMASNPSIQPIVAAGIVDLLNLYISLNRNLLPFCLSQQSKNVIIEFYSVVQNISNVLFAEYPEGTPNFPKATGAVFLIIKEIISIFDMHLSPELYSTAMEETSKFIENNPSNAWMMMRASNTLNMFKSRVIIIEKCIESDIFQHYDWNRTISHISIPEIDQALFIQNCLDQKCGFLLYSHCLQVISKNNPEELKILVSESVKWHQINGTFGYKALLIWSKIIECITILYMIQPSSEHEKLIQMLDSILDHIIDDAKQPIGFWDISLNQKYSHSKSYIVSIKMLIFFVLHQYNRDSEGMKKIRIDPSSPPCSIDNIEKLKSDIMDDTEGSSMFNDLMNFINNQDNTMRDLRKIINLIIENQYSPKISKLFN